MGACCRAEKRAKKWAEESHGKASVAGVKTEARALQKVFRSYATNWSKLCDLVRTSIVFNSPHDIATCICLIANDPDVALLKVKKGKCRLRLNHPVPSGYRDVQLCAKLVCNESTAPEERLPRVCDGLVVEIQLHLKAIYDIKSDEGHAAYVRARNLLGE